MVPAASTRTAKTIKQARLISAINPLANTQERDENGHAARLQTPPAAGAGAYTPLTLRAGIGFLYSQYE
jgi:hypothetical protein